MSHPAIPVLDDTTLCRTCRKRIFWVRDYDEGRVYRHVSDLSPRDIPTELYGALRTIYPLEGKATLRRSQLYDLVRDGGLQLTSLEYLKALDALSKDGRIKISKGRSGPDVIEVVRGESER